MKFIYQLIESVVTGEVDPEEAVSGWGKKGVEREHIHYSNDMPTHAKDVPSDSSKINSMVNHYGPKCAASCEPKPMSGKKQQKDEKCRMTRLARPMDRSKVTEITRDETVSELTLHR